MSRLRLLRAYKELRAQHVSSSQIESILSQINKGRSVKYALYGLQKVESYWKIVELDDLINNIFKLQLNIRRGMGASADMVPLICLYCSAKGRHSK
jgi:DNA polymerase-3 subunit delta